MELLWIGLTDAVQMLIDRDPLVISAGWRSLWISITAVGIASVPGVTIGSVLARKKFMGCGLLVVLFRAGMSVPTVLIGLLCFGMLSRRGPLAGLDLLYTPWGIIVGEFLLALPIIATWTHGAIWKIDPRVAETALTLGADRGAPDHCAVGARIYSKPAWRFCWHC